MTNEETIKNLKKLKSFHNGSYGTAINEAIKALEQQPMMGEWIKEHHTIKCNNCNTIIFTSCDYNDRQEYRDMVMDDYIEQYRYCPFCGSRMNGGGEDAEELTK